MPPIAPKEFMLYYAAITVLLIFLLFRGKRAKGMRLRLRGEGKKVAQLTATEGMESKLSRPRGSSPPGGASPPPAPAAAAAAHSSGPGAGGPSFAGERPLNVVFNFNGHSWDAYEVLGLAAGSSLEKVEAAFRAAMVDVDPDSQAFLEAALQAIQQQWGSFRKSGS